LTEEGLRIFTSFDPILQEKAETSVNETLKRLSGRKGVDQVEEGRIGAVGHAALPGNAERALLGGVDFLLGRHALLGVTRQGSMADSSYPAFLDLVGSLAPPEALGRFVY
ncbi:hypothetical protein ACV333_32635, partial [Pseudomonas aeruginosa]